MRTLLLTAAFVVLAGLSYAQVGGTLLKKEEIPRTIELLKQGSAKQRIYAAEALGQRGAIRSADVKDAVGPLRELLKSDKDVNVRKAAAQALGNIGRELDQTIPALLEAMRSDKADAVKLAAIGALGQIGPEARSAVPELRAIARNKKKENRRFSGAARNAIKAINAK
jgi:HEAT repeat protein